MSSDDVQTGRDELQFDRVETSGEQPGERTAGPDVTCVVCGKSVGSEYYHINDKPVCESCRQTVIAAAVTPRTAGPLVRAGLFGLVAAIAGAAIYYAVIAITKFEIGLVAILIGYMVGYMVRKGAGGRGGRRFQILAVVLTLGRRPRVHTARVQGHDGREAQLGRLDFGHLRRLGHVIAAGVGDR